MRTKRVFSLTSLFLAGAAVCGCQSSNPTPVRPSPWAGQQTQTRPIQSQGMAMQPGSSTMSPGGMVMQPGAGGIPQNQYSTTSTQGTGMQTGGGIYGNSYNATSGLGGQTGMTGSGLGSNVTPSSSYPGQGNTSVQQRSNYSSGLGGTEMRTTQYPGSTSATSELPVPPTNTLQPSSQFAPR
jgi:hypothetical protein